MEKIIGTFDGKGQVFNVLTIATRSVVLLLLYSANYDNLFKINKMRLFLFIFSEMNTFNTK